MGVGEVSTTISSGTSANITSVTGGEVLSVTQSGTQPPSIAPSRTPGGMAVAIDGGVISSATVSGSEFSFGPPYGYLNVSSRRHR